MKTLLLCTLLFSLYTISAQDSLKSVKAIRINDVGLQINLFSSSENYTFLDDFRALAPQSALLKNELTEYSPQSNTNVFSTISSNPVLSVFAGFKFSNKEKNAYRKHIRFNTGLTLFNQQVSGYYNYTKTKPYDVLTSGTTGNTVRLDSVINKSYSMMYSSSQLRLDVSFLWSTSQEKRRIAFYTGLGISAGMSFNSSTSINYSTYSQVRLNTQGEQYSSYSQESGSYTGEVFKSNKKDYGLAVYIPLGADLVLGKTRRFWKNTHVYYDIKPCYNALKIPGIRDFGSIGILHGWGLRFTV